MRGETKRDNNTNSDPEAKAASREAMPAMAEFPSPDTNRAGSILPGHGLHFFRRPPSSVSRESGM